MLEQFISSKVLNHLSKIGSLFISTRHFGIDSVIGLNLVPNPADRSNALIYYGIFLEIINLV